MTYWVRHRLRFAKLVFRKRGQKWKFSAPQEGYKNLALYIV